jgi:hypothetical protein
MASEARTLVSKSAPIDVHPYSQTADNQQIEAKLRSVVRHHGMLDGEADFDFILVREVDREGRHRWVAAVTSTIPWRATRWAACQLAVNAVCAQYL